jgi:hypothetical protein
MSEQLRLLIAERLLGWALRIMPPYHPDTVALAYLVRTYFQRHEERP